MATLKERREKYYRKFVALVNKKNRNAKNKKEIEEDEDITVSGKHIVT
jgi:hypothetical protein